MRVVLDSSVVIPRFLLRDRELQSLFAQAMRTGHALYIPEIVVREIVNRYEEAVGARVAKVSDTLGQLGDLLLVPAPPILSQADVRESVEGYEPWLRKKLEEHQVEVLPIPDVPHEEAMAWDLARKRPFKATGNGYRDFMIWKTIVELAATEGLGVAFVSANTKDFADGEILHGDLTCDLAAHDLPTDRVILCSSIAGFLETHVEPVSRTPEFIRAELQSGTYAALSVRDWITDNFTACAEDGRVGPRFIGLPEGLWGPQVWAVISVDRLTVVEVTVVSGTDVEVRCSARVRVDATCEFDSDQYDVLSRKPSPVYEGDQRVVGSVVLPAEIGLTLRFSVEGSAAASGEVTTFDVDCTELSEDWEPNRPFRFGLAIGDKVEHGTFGVGFVVSLDRWMGSDTVGVAFPGSVPRRFALDLAPLSIMATEPNGKEPPAAP